VIAACLWWLYFDVVALVAERRLSQAEGEAQVRMARDSYTVLHLPMVAGIVFFALGVKKVLLKPDDPLNVVAETALLGGIALYLLAHVLFRYRNTRSWSVPRSVVAVVFVLAIVPLQDVSAITVLVAASITLIVLTAYESIKYREARHAVRHHGVGGTWVRERRVEDAADSDERAAGQ
jgi:low temperature requirement protein LtrA